MPYIDTTGTRRPQNITEESMTQPQQPYSPGNSRPAPTPHPYNPPPSNNPLVPGGPAASSANAPAAGQPTRRRRRSIAWIYYSIIAVISVFAAISTGKPQVLIATALCAAYAVYLFRGGRIVFWIW